MKRKILGKEFEVEEVERYIKELKYYPENPRVYSLLYAHGGDELPSQEEIENLMFSREHVKQLKEDIRRNGLLDPIIIKGDIVLEGNSRLAAHRMLDKEGSSLEWKTITCLVLPDDIEDTYIFALLGKYHIKGRTDWEPYEKASYLYRRNKLTKIPIPTMARELDLQESQVKRMIEVIEIMVKHNDDNKKHYSHYEEYLKSASLKKYRETNPDIDDTVAKSIKSGEIHEAADIRKLSDVAKVNSKPAKRIMQKVSEGTMSIYEAHEIVANSGATDDVVKRLSKFRDQINRDSFTKQINSSTEVRNKALFEIDKICRRLEKIKKSLNQS